MSNIFKFYTLWFFVLLIFGLPNALTRYQERKDVEARIAASYEFFETLPKSISIEQLVKFAKNEFPGKISKQTVMLKLKDGGILLLIEFRNARYLALAPVKTINNPNLITWQCFSPRHFRIDEIPEKFPLVEIGLMPKKCR